MSVFFSRQCEYALRAVLYLALKPPGEMTSIKDLSSTLGIPRHFVGKILQDLTYKGLLTSQKGPSGGFALAIPAKDITFFHIVEAVDGVAFTNECLMGFPECSEKNPCAVHNHWTGLREGIYGMLVNKNIGEMAKEMKKPEYRTATG
ncbi:MAG: Rrf2 family transcriptional regulator [Ignavibacteriales bacterium]|nr:Rrf2 family transcriptional regulator [Ignavibacteriales bacterium]